MQRQGNLPNPSSTAPRQGGMSPTHPRAASVQPLRVTMNDIRNLHGNVMITQNANLTNNINYFTTPRQPPIPQSQHEARSALPQGNMSVSQTPVPPVQNGAIPNCGYGNMIPQNHGTLELSYISLMGSFANVAAAISAQVVAPPHNGATANPRYQNMLPQQHGMLELFHTTVTRSFANTDAAKGSHLIAQPPNGASVDPRYQNIVCQHPCMFKPHFHKQYEA